MRSSKRAIAILDQCLTMVHIKQVQSQLAVFGTLFDPYTADKIIASYCLHDLNHTYQLFCSMPHRTTYIWNVMIRAFTDRNEPTTALPIYTYMLRSGLLPDNYTMSFVLQGCAQLSCLSFGLLLHHFSFQHLNHGFSLNKTKWVLNNNGCQ